MPAVLAQRYRRDAGVGTVVSLMITYALVISLVWALFLAARYLPGIPLGPGAPVEILR